MIQTSAPPEGILAHSAPLSPRQRCGVSCLPETTHSRVNQLRGWGRVSWKTGGPLLHAGLGDFILGPFVVDEWTRDFRASAGSGTEPHGAGGGHWISPEEKPVESFQPCVKDVQLFPEDQEGVLATEMLRIFCGKKGEREKGRRERGSSKALEINAPLGGEGKQNPGNPFQ